MTIAKPNRFHIHLVKLTIIKEYILPGSLIILLFFLSNCAPDKDSSTPQSVDLQQMKKEISDNLTQNLLPYWSTKMIDSLNGGFYGRVDAYEKVYPDSDKGGILNARILWTYSSAFRVLNDSSYLHLADYAYDYIIHHFIDKEFGGAYRVLKANGEPGDARKHILTESYFIYAFAEYYRATGHPEALKQAIDIFELVEEYALDRESNGYFEVFTRDWERSHDLLLNERSTKDEKTMITHLHLVEAYAGLYRVWPEKRMEERLRNVLMVFNSGVVDPDTHHLHYFLDRNWIPTTAIDSYGHDIEASWLIDEAAGLLGDSLLQAEIRNLSVKIADAAAEGLREDGSMLTEKDNDTGHTVTIRSWWEQAESVVGYLNAYELTGDETYLEKSFNSWNYIKKHFVDYDNGGWYPLVSEEGESIGRDKANYWTCPYHNGRMCLEVIERIGESSI